MGDLADDDPPVADEQRAGRGVDAGGTDRLGPIRALETDRASCRDLAVGPRRGVEAAAAEVGRSGLEGAQEGVEQGDVIDRSPGRGVGATSSIRPDPVGTTPRPSRC